MKILVYGFGPYQIFKENITSKIVKKLKPKYKIYKKIFLVKFDRAQFIREIKKIQPDLIIGLGQSGGPNSRRKKITIERKALNLRPSGKRLSKIEESKPEKVLVNLRIKTNKYSRISYNAGTYVCNFSMWVNATYAKSNGIKYAFIHIPYNFNLGRAVRFVEGKINLAVNAQK